MKRVTSLTIDMFGVTDEMLICIGQHCPQLQQVCLTQDVYECCPRYSATGIVNLILQLANLELIVVHKDAYVPSLVAGLMARWPSLKFTFLNSMLYRVLEIGV